MSKAVTLSKFKSASNPIGIISLFISLVYVLASLVLSINGAKTGLSDRHQEMLIWFLLSFPYAVLLSFVFLVSRHHEKLYGPQDYRTDESFLNIKRYQLRPEKSKDRIEREISKIKEETKGLPALDMDIEKLFITSKELALSELDDSLGNIPMASNIKFGQDVVFDRFFSDDGVSHGVIYRLALGGYIEDLKRQFDAIKAEISRINWDIFAVYIVLVYVNEVESDKVKELNKISHGYGFNAILKIYSYQELTTKRGLAVIKKGE